MNQVECGQLVISAAGRDAGACFIVIDVKTPYCFLSDGKTRRVEHPKKKKLKHLNVTAIHFEEIGNKLISDAKVSNAEIRNALKSANINS